MTIKRALISGAGIAGAALAYWLTRDKWAVTVVEKATPDRSSGSPVDVRGRAVDIARAMGIEEHLRAADTGVDRAAFIDGDGKTRAVIRTRAHATGDKLAEFEVPRALLAAALLDAVPAHVPIVSGDSITSLYQDGSGVDVEFERSPGDRFDVVFGADGLHSTVRRLAFGPETDYAHPFGLFIGTLRFPIEVEDPRQVLLFNEPNRLLAVHPAGGNPGAAFIFRSDDAYNHHDAAAGKAMVESAYANSGWLAPALLPAWRTAEDFYFDAVTRIEMCSWSRGRVALLGDAASCLSLLGEGSSNAIVAAKTFADALLRHEGNHATAFTHYEHTHRARLRKYQRGARPMSHFLVPVTGYGITIRDWLIRTASLLAGRRAPN
ncbi:MAG: FAD-dependent monooxygenase [Leifsonia sp.]